MGRHGCIGEQGMGDSWYRGEMEEPGRAAGEGF